MSAGGVFSLQAGARPGCELCQKTGGVPVVATPDWRVIRVDDVDFPAFYRVVWNAHVAEFTELGPAARVRCMEVVSHVEQVLRARVKPTKINLAALGNVVPHLHWHVVARFDWDSHFPQPIWGVRQRGVEPSAVSRLPLSLDELDAAVRQALSPLVPA